MNDVVSAHSKPAASAATIDMRPTKPTAEPLQAPNERHIAQFTDRFERARKYSRSTQISRFGAHQASSQDPAKSPGAVANPPAGTAPQAEMPRLTTTQHEAMSRLPRHAPPSAPLPRPALAAAAPRFSPAAGRAASIAAVVVVMGAYIWLQNFPKLAIQNAADRAGLAASMPSYVPSTYSLASTSSGPGLVTLSFTSPSVPEPLKIAQHRTTWDSSSLLDNVVAKTSDDYAAVQGQGLTIYFWGQNQAAWVNHGVWYQVDGATHLSRDQVLKMAYSL